MAASVPLRQDVAPEYTWNRASVFPDDGAWIAEIGRVSAALETIEGFRGRLDEGPARLADWFEAREALLSALGKVTVYANIEYAVDSGNTQSAARADRARTLQARVNAAMAFAEPELLAVGFERLRQWLAAEPRLALYAHYIDNLETLALHIRSAEVEEVLAGVEDPLGTALESHYLLVATDLTFRPAQSGTPGAPPIEVAQGNFNPLTEHADRTVRRSAFESYHDAHLSVKNTLANTLAASVKADVFRARTRGYRSALEASLSHNHIPVEVFHNLIDAFRRNLPIWHRYWGVMRRALGVERLRLYDVKTPLARLHPRVPFDQAVEWICAGLRPLGDDYVAVLRRGLTEERWVDLYPNKGKTPGAFSDGRPGTFPFIVMSYTDELVSMSTLAHELGHSMHSYLTWQAQPHIYTDYSLFVAEVASNFHQAMVRGYLLAQPHEPEFEVALIDEAMSNFTRYLFTMPTLARFELEVHRRVEGGAALTAPVMNTLMADLFREAYGDEVEISGADAERLGITWAEFPHLYSAFYVYQYATGISAANALAKGVLAGRQGAAADYVSFLKAGSSLYPLDALKLAGVDLASPDPVDTAFGVLADTVDRLEMLVAQRAA